MKRVKKQSITELVKVIKRRIHSTFSSEEKIRIVLEGLRGEESVTTACRKYTIHQNFYFKRSKDFLEAGKRRLSVDTVREASTDEEKDIRDQNSALKQELTELYLQNEVIKKLEWIRVKWKKNKRFTRDEKMEIIKLVEGSDIAVNRTLKEPGIHKHTFYSGHHRYSEKRFEGLTFYIRADQRVCNQIPKERWEQVIVTALELR